MDPSKYKRRATQKSYRQISKTNLYNDALVREGYTERPVIDREMAMRMRTASSQRRSIVLNQGRTATPAVLTPQAPVEISRNELDVQSLTQLSNIQKPTIMPSPVLERTTPIQPINSTQAQVLSLNPQSTQVKTAGTTRLPAIDMDLPGDQSPYKIESFLGGVKTGGFRKWAFRATAVGLVLFITMGGLLISQTFINANKMFRGSAGTASALNSDFNPDMLKGEGSGRINVLLLGRGGGNHDAPDLTDTIMLASIDPVNHKATLLSIPRDMWVAVPGKGPMKLNAAWQTGRNDYQKNFKVKANDPKAMDAGFKLLNKTVQEIVGMNIDYNVIVNFQAFKQAVDTVGGVDVNVPSDLVDPTMAWENANDPTLAKAGPQVFDGTHALIYVRSRETTSDFARSERQRAVILALKDKASSAGTLSNPMKISGLIKAFGDNVYTDLSVKNAARLYSIVQKISGIDIKTIGLTDSANPLLNTGNVNGQSIVLPKKGLFKYSEIQNFLKSQIINPYILKEKARVMVLNGSGVEGLATVEADMLKKSGYNVVGTANTPQSGYSQTLLIDINGKNKSFTKKLLEQKLKVKALSSMPDDTIPTNGADFVIILGSNETITTKAQTN